MSLSLEEVIENYLTMNKGSISNVEMRALLSNSYLQTNMVMMNKTTSKALTPLEETLINSNNNSSKFKISIIQQKMRKCSIVTA
jgi:hypothetical protein